MSSDQNQIVDHRSYPSSLDRTVMYRHIIPLHGRRSDDAKNIVRNHGQFQNQCICIKLAAGQALDAHVSLDLAVILFTDSIRLCDIILYCSAKAEPRF